jgi:hypothetical protein
MKRIGKLSLSKETLWQMDAQRDTTIVGGGNDSCRDSCYLVSCGGGCGISTGEKD